ncbi:MAG: hypothetical protein AB7G68_11345 [Nitrospiraceae bacterium]
MASLTCAASSDGMESNIMSERLRLETLLARDGSDEARRWASWAAALYRRSSQDSAHYASQPDFKPLFEQSSRELESFAENGVLP